MRTTEITDNQALQNLAAVAELEEQKKPVGNGGGEIAAAIDIPTADIVGQLLGITFGMVAAKAGDHWALNAGELKVAGDAYGAVIDKYIPNFGNSMSVEISAVLVTGMLVIPRLAESKQKPIVDTSENEDVNESAVVDGMPTMNKGDDKNGG